MKVFLDCEFTDFDQLYLISLGMAVEVGEDFYAGVSYSAHACPEFARDKAMPLMEKIDHCFFTRDNLRLEIIDGLKISRHGNEDVFIWVDHLTRPMGIYSQTRRNIKCRFGAIQNT